MRNYIENIAEYIVSTELFYKLPIFTDIGVVDLEIVDHWIEWLGEMAREYELLPLIWDRRNPPSVIATTNALLVLSRSREDELDSMVKTLSNRRSKIGFWNEVYSAIPLLKKIIPFEWNYTRLSVYTSLKVVKALSTIGYENIILDFIDRLESIQGRSGLWISNSLGDIEMTSLILLYCNKYLSEQSKEKAISALRTWLKDQLYTAMNINTLKKALASLALIASGEMEVEFRNLTEYVKELLRLQSPEGSLDFTPNRNNRKWITVEILEHALRYIPELKCEIKKYIHRYLSRLDSLHRLLEELEDKATEYFREVLEENVLNGVKEDSIRLYLLLLSSIFEQFYWVENRDSIEYLSKFKNIIYEGEFQHVLNNEKIVVKILEKVLPNRVGNNTISKLATTISTLYGFFKDYPMNDLKKFYRDFFEYTVEKIPVKLNPDTDVDKVSNLAIALRIGINEIPSIKLLCTTLRVYPCIGVNTIISFLYYTRMFNIIDNLRDYDLEIPLDYRLVDILSRIGIIKRSRNINIRESLNRVAFELAPHDKLRILVLRYLWANYCMRGKYLHISPATDCPLRMICNCRFLSKS